MRCGPDDNHDRLHKGLTMQRFTVLGALTLIAAASVSPSAAAGVRAGTLHCRGGESISYMIGSVAHFNCVFRPIAGRP